MTHELLDERAAALRERAETAGQGHVFRFWERLDEAGRRALCDQLDAVDFELMRTLHAQAVAPPSAATPALEPPALFPLSRAPAQRERASQAAQRGAGALAAGRVGYLLVAGGQASRLGYDGPKGAFPIGPVTDRLLFEFHARRLLAAQARHGAPTPWYVMTSPANHERTQAIFSEYEHFGLPPEDVFFFSQAMLPALDTEGGILMAGPGQLFLAPNGHGGVYAALRDSGALDDMARRGVETLSYFQVDNPLARPADPLFVGLHLEEGAGMSSKVVAKRDAAEKVGVLGRVDGRMGCIEYSDLPDELREAREPDADGGQLLFRAGNIAVQLIQTSFIHEFTDGALSLPWHVARKSMAVLDERGDPTQRDGFKFETFVFDALSESQSSVTLEVARELEFSPVKNAAGEDSPLSCRRDLSRLFAGWAERAGHPLPAPDAHGNLPVEVDPCFAEDESEFRARGAEPEVTERGHLYR